jgi:uncharacterized protein (UPF0371 family)
MLVRNFPGRKNDRRIKALARLKNNLNIHIPETPENKEDLKNRKARINREIQILEERILEPQVARGIRSKKRRKAN